jgi:hypothetical protein
LVEEAGVLGGLIELDKFLREEVNLTIDLVHGPRMVITAVIVGVVTYILKIRPGLPRVGLRRIRIGATARVVRITGLGRCRRDRRRDGIWIWIWNGVICALRAISLTRAKLIANTALVVITSRNRILGHPVYRHTGVIGEPYLIKVAWYIARTPIREPRRLVCAANTILRGQAEELEPL